MLVSLAITLIMMGAVVTLFGTISDSVSGSRSMIEISERLRATRNRLQTDLQGATATMKPPLRPENDEGYFELIEGPEIDATNYVYAPTNTFPPTPPTRVPLPRPPISAGTSTQVLASAIGDTDDVLMFTVRSRGEPFVGRYFNATTNAFTTFESEVAEVAYFCAPAMNGQSQQTDTTLFIDGTGTPVRTLTLYRRVLLVSPAIAQSTTFSPDPTPAPNNFFEIYDLSARVQTDSTGVDKMVPNTLGDLTKRENRFAHYDDFPFDLNAAPPAKLGGAYVPPTDVPNDSSAFLVPFFGGNQSAGIPASPRFGDDVLLTNVLAFDVQVYDPLAEVQVGTSTSLTPVDPSYSTGGGVLGAYADLGWRGGAAAPFNLGRRQTVTQAGATIVPHIPKYVNPTTNPPATGAGVITDTYDTWSMHYENNGVDDDGGGAIDEGTDGLDDATDGVVGIVDDAGEMETRPPFAAPLRGIRVTIRVYEPSSQQVRQMTVVGDFLPD